LRAEEVTGDGVFMSSSPSASAGVRRAATAAVLPALALVVAVVLGWRAWDAERAHRAAASRTVQDYAAFAATLVGAGASTALEQTLFYAFYPVDQAERAGSGPVPPSALTDNRQERNRCSSSDPEGFWAGRITPDASALEVQGSVPAGLRLWLSDTLSVLVRGGRRVSPYGNLFPPARPEKYPAVAYRVQSDTTGAPMAVYVLPHCFETRSGNAFAAAESNAVLLPPGLVGPGPPDSLLSLRVTAADGRLVFRSPVSWISDFRGVRPPDASGPLAGLSFTVTLRPELADRLVAGGIPPSRVPLTAALLVLAGVLILATVVQVRRALALVRLRERFVADVSHELRTPLQQILMFVQLMRMGQLRAEDEQKDSLGIIERETRRLVRLVERLLGFAGLGAGGSVPDEPVEVVALVRETVSGFAPTAEPDGTRIEVEASREEVWIRGAYDALRQILSNLLDNALKYGPPGQTVRVSIRPDSDRVRVSVDDEGPGIPPADRSRVWEPFRRLDREEVAARTGSGVGLAIVQELAERMEGRAWVEDAPGGGARFTLEVLAVAASGETVHHA
jgi:signal transduction histidine kinase